MPILLYCVGAVAFAMGAAAIGYGIPINEFSFGNTLIIAGTVLLTGGLVVLALGVVVSRLQDLAQASGARPGAVRFGRVEGEMQPTLRAAAQPGVARVPFPPKPKAPLRPEAAPEPARPLAEPSPPEAATAETAEVPPPPPPAARPFALPPLPKRPLREPEEVAEASSPLLPNPEVGADQPSEDHLDRAVPASDWEIKARAEAEPPLDFPPFRPESHPADEDEAEQAALEQEGPPFVEPAGAEPFRPAARASADSGSFDAMWPASPKLPKETKEAASAEPKEAASAEPKEAASAGPAEEAGEVNEPPHEEPRTPAILKSGVVDGMGYTLYVDGSIEAELPQGTLRFASINELRAHLEKSS